MAWPQTRQNCMPVRTVTAGICDGTHSKIGFQAAAQAVPDSAESPADSGAAGVSAGNVAVPATALDAAESDGVISDVDPADVEKAESTGSKE
jgi:hypothetical protein